MKPITLQISIITKTISSISFKKYFLIPLLLSNFLLSYKVFSQPSINSFSPSSGSVGTLVTINGNNLGSSTNVAVGGVNAIIISKDTSTIKCMIMPGTITGTISVTTLYGIAKSSSSFNVTPTNVPVHQNGPKLIGTGAVGGQPCQGSACAISGDGNIMVVGGQRDSDTSAIHGAIWIYVKNGNTWLQQGLKLLATDMTYSNSYFGVSVDISYDGNTIVVGGYTNNNDEGGAWVFNRNGNNWVQQGNKLLGSGAKGKAKQGISVSISGDGNTAVIGGDNDDSSQGAAWVFIRNGNNWIQQGQKLVGFGNNGLANQGYSVATDYYGSTIAIGGINDDSSNGAVWIFTRNGNSWVQQGNKLVGAGAINTAFQGVLSLSNDGNTLVIGGFRDSLYTGAAWVFTRTNNVWSQQGSKLVGSNSVGQAYQGSSIAISGDGNTIIIGGYGDSSYFGAAWVFTRNGNSWIQQGNKIIGTGNIWSAQFGICVSLSNDGNTAVIGGSSDNNYQGAVWVFTRSLNSWSQLGPKLVGTGVVASSNQGYSVAISADGNTAVVGGYQDNYNKGAVWVYTNNNNIWSQQGDKLVSNDGTFWSQFGISVAISSDGNTLATGGNQDSSGMGAVWVFTRNGNIWTQQGAKLVGTGAINLGAGNIQQGNSVAISADGNTIIFGGIGDNYNQGAVWVFTRNNNTWAQQGSKLVGTGSVGLNVYQGRSVAISADGNTAIIGGWDDNSGVGAAWIFTRNSNIWSQQGGKLVGTGAISSSQGRAVALSADGNIAFVGGNMDNSNQGAVWVFTRAGNSWTQQGNKLVCTGYIGASQFGVSVSASADGNVLIVGGRLDNNQLGATWIFVKIGNAWLQLGIKLIGKGSASTPTFQGHSVAISSDGNTAIIGGYHDYGSLGAAWIFYSTYSTSINILPNVDKHNFSLKLYPNPNTGTFTINFNNTEGEKQIAIYNLQGKLVAHYTTNESVYEVNEMLTRGMYFIKAETTQGSFNTKFVVE